MDNLQSFLKENIDNEIEKEIIVSNRFLDENKEVIKWKIRCISTLTDESIRKMSYINDEFDYNKYLGKLTASCIVYPNLKSVTLQNSYETYLEDELLKIMLLPGEYASLVEKVQEINGFNETFTELIDTAKN